MLFYINTRHSRDLLSGTLKLITYLYFNVLYTVLCFIIPQTLQYFYAILHQCEAFAIGGVDRPRVAIESLHQGGCCSPITNAIITTVPPGFPWIQSLAVGRNSLDTLDQLHTTGKRLLLKRCTCQHCQPTISVNLPKFPQHFALVRHHPKKETKIHKSTTKNMV